MTKEKLKQLKENLIKELKMIGKFFCKISPIHKMENYKRLGYGINWSITSDGLFRQITIRVQSESKHQSNSQ